MNKTAIERQTKQLAQSIQMSDEFREFEAIRRQMCKDPALMKEINQVRKAYFEALNGENPGEAFQVQTKFAASLSKGGVREFLEKEQQFCMMMQSVHDILDEAVSFDMAFILEEVSKNDG